jgi:hypothetical protein
MPAESSSPGPFAETSEQAASTTSVAVGDARPLAERPSSRSWVSAQRERLVAAAALGGIFVIAALAYWWTRAPLYNPWGTIDPWLYTALFVNFDEIYEPFHNTYYAARLPWVVPGRIVYGVLPVDAAYWVLHGLAFVGGVTALFVLVRRHLGLAMAVIGGSTLALSQLYWNAQHWDYVDGVTVTYVLASLCFGLPLASGRRRAASLTAAGVFFAAAVTTNPFAALVVLIHPILYVFVQPATGLRRRCALALKDLAALVGGAAVLVVALGFYARWNGGAFLYFEPQLDFARSGGAPKLSGYEWLRSEPRLLVPVFLIAVAGPLLVLGRRLPPFRFAAGSVGGLTFLTGVTYGWEFFAGGSILEYTYYFSYFTISIALTLASIAALAVSLARPHWSVHAGAIAATIGAAVVTLGLIFRDDRAEWTGRAGARISIAIMAVAILLMLGALIIHRTRIGAVGAVVAVGAVAAASHFAIDSSNGMFLYGTTAPENRSLYHAALDNVAFVNRATTQDDGLPAFWYRGTRTDFTSIQSMYYYAFTALAFDLPSVTRETRERLDLWKPQTIVMLCEIRDCIVGAAALRRAGYSYSRQSAELISRGRVRFWAVLLRRTSSE